MTRLEGTVWKRNAGFLRPWRSRPAVVTDDGYLQYTKKKGNNGKAKEIDLVKSDIAQHVTHMHGYYCFSVQSGSKSFFLGFPSEHDAESWLEVLHEVADENAAGRRAWVANLRRLLAMAQLRERRELVREMSDRDWTTEWMFCLRSLKNNDKSLSSRRRRLKRLYAIWVQFHLFAEVLADIFVTSGATTDFTASASAPTTTKKASDHVSEADSDQRSVDSSTSSSNGHVAMRVSSPRSALRNDDVDELRFATIRLQVGAKSWRGYKRLEREVVALARFRAVVDFVTAERIVDARVIDALPTLPLMAALVVRGVRVVATAEPLSDRFTVASMDKRDLAELVQALKLTKMLRAFAYSDVPDIWLRRTPGSTERTMIGVTSRYDDVLMQSLRSPLVHGMLIRASEPGSDSSNSTTTAFELLTAHDMHELVQHCNAHWVPYLDVVYYVLEPSSGSSKAATAAKAVENTRARAFLRTAPSASLTGDVVVSVDTDRCRLPLTLKEAFVLAQQLDVLPLVRRIEDVKTNAARIHVAVTASSSSSGGNGTVLTPQKVDAGLAVAKTAETSLKSLLVQSIRAFTASLVTFGDSSIPAAAVNPLGSAASPMQKQQQQQQAPTALQPRALFTRSNTEPTAFGQSESSSSNIDPRAQQLRRRRSWLAATAGASAATSGSSTARSETYVIDTIHLRDAMRDSGINMRFLPLVFTAVDSARQPGVQTLVASAIVARLAKTLFRFQLLHGTGGAGVSDNGDSDSASAQRWATRKQRAVQFIDSIMHGVFHTDLPDRRCDVRECVGEQFWSVDAPLLLLLGPMASSAALDYTCVRDGAVVAAYRHAVRSNPSALFTALLHALDAQLTANVLPELHENRFVSMPFFRTARDVAFRSDDEGDGDDDNGDGSALALMLQPELLSSYAQFFRLHFTELKRLSSGGGDHLGSLSSGRSSRGSSAKDPRRPSDSFAEVDSDRQYFADITAHVRQSLGLAQPLRLERAARAWDTAHAVRSRLVKALRAASVDDDSRGVAREYCDEALELLDGASGSRSPPRVPVEYLIALRCLTLVANSDEQQLLRADAWTSTLTALRFFYRPASQAQFAQSASAHPLAAIVTFMIELGSGMRDGSGTDSSTSDSRRAQFERTQQQQSWLQVISAVDAHCRRAVAKSWTLDAVTSIATKVASLAFEKTRVANAASSSSLSSLSSAASDDRTDSLSEPQFAKTARALSTESQITSAAMRQDVLWFVESFLLPSLRSGSLLLTRETFDSVLRLTSASASVSSLAIRPAPGVALVWGEPFGLSLDDESQIASAPSGSKLADLQPRPSPAARDSVALLTIPSALRRVVQVACGYRHTALVADNRQLYTFGYGECGRLGHGNEESVTQPTAVSYFAGLIDLVGASVGGIAHVACGREHTMAVLANGDLYGFGWAEAGRLGTGDTGCCAFPTKVSALQGVQATACGREHSLALTADGHVYAFGAGFGGRLGTGTEADEEFPARVLGALAGETIVRVDAGECHSAAVSAAGDVFTWGFGSSGALGTGTRENSLQPVKIAGAWTDDLDANGTASNVTSVACGGYHTLVSTSVGKLYGWGDSAAGQLGSEHLAAPDMVVLAPAEIRLPTRASARTAIREIASGTFTSAVCTDDGKVFMWGSAAAGNGAVLRPEDADVACVSALDEFAIGRIACGAYHTVVLTRGLEYA